MYYAVQAVNNNDTDQTVQMRRLICAFVVRIWQNRFSHEGAHMEVYKNNIYYYIIYYMLDV